MRRTLPLIAAMVLVAVVTPLTSAGVVLAANLFLPLPANLPERTPPSPSPDQPRVRRRRQRDRHLQAVRDEHPCPAGGHPGGPEAGGGGGRGPALLLPRRRRRPGHDAGPARRPPRPRRVAGRLDDHPAAGEEHAHRRRALDQPQDPRGGAGQPARPPDGQGRHPLRVPVGHLPRRGRLRGGGGRRDLLPQAGQPAHAVRVGPAGGRHPRPQPLQPPGRPGRGGDPAPPGARHHARRGDDRPGPARRGRRPAGVAGRLRSPARAGHGRVSRRRRSSRPTPTSPTTCAGGWRRTCPAGPTRSSTAASHRDHARSRRPGGGPRSRSRSSSTAPSPTCARRSSRSSRRPGTSGRSCPGATSPPTA